MGAYHNIYHYPLFSIPLPLLPSYLPMFPQRSIPSSTTDMNFLELRIQWNGSNANWALAYGKVRQPCFKESAS